MSTMDDFFKAKNINPSSQELSRSYKAVPEGDIEKRKYRNYYDRDDTITTAQAIDPHDPDNANYNQERVFEILERNAEQITVVNDEPSGGATLFVIVSHMGGQDFSAERPIYPQEPKTYWNVCELRLRSAKQGHSYRVTEYEIGEM